MFRMYSSKNATLSISIFEKAVQTLLVHLCEKLFLNDYCMSGKNSGSPNSATPNLATSSCIDELSIQSAKACAASS